jgi:Uncharacterized conserved protein (DUF2285)
MRVAVELDPDVADEAPSGNVVTPYDEQHYVTYLRLLDASRDGADWQDVARIVLHRDPVTEEARSRHCWESHLARAQWLSGSGYRRILEQAVATAARGGGRA